MGYVHYGHTARQIAPQGDRATRGALGAGTLMHHVPARNMPVTATSTALNRGGLLSLAGNEFWTLTAV